MIEIYKKIRKFIADPENKGAVAAMHAYVALTVSIIALIVATNS